MFSPASTARNSPAPVPASAHGPTPSFSEVSGRYRVRFAHTEEEIAAACRLRFEVFNLELGEGLASAHLMGEDRDPFDASCQHLIVESLPDGIGSLRAGGRAPVVVGTYRLQTAATARASKTGFYSDGIFDLSTLPSSMLEDSVELGRACVRRDHRNRRTLFLLWRGLAAYVLWHNKRWFFGCNSMSTESHLEGQRMMSYLERHGHVHAGLKVEPQEGYRCTGRAGSQLEDQFTQEIPSLFGIYLRYGAKVCGPPAHDWRFHTVDFLTVVDLHEMDERTFQNFAAH